MQIIHYDRENKGFKYSPVVMVVSYLNFWVLFFLFIYKIDVDCISGNVRSYAVV